MTPIANEDCIAHWGAIADDDTDCSPALERWLRHLIDNNRHGFVPSGRYRLKSGTTIEKTGAPAVFGWSGQGVTSRFVIDRSNTQGGIKIDLSRTADRSDQMATDSWVMEVEGRAEYGFHVTESPGGNQHQHGLTVTDVCIESQDQRTDYVRRPMSFRGMWRPMLTRVIWSGPHIGQDNRAGSNMFKAEIGIDVDDCYDPRFDGGYVWGAAVGVRSYGTNQEAFRAHGQVINHVMRGYDLRRSSREPLLSITSCHVNAVEFAAYLDGWRLVNLQGNWLYNEDDEQVLGKTPVDLYLRNVSDFNIADNWFHYNGHPRRVGIVVDSRTAGAGRNGFIERNQFSGEFRYAAWLTNKSENVLFDRNMITGQLNQSSPVYNSGGTKNKVSLL